MRISIKGERQPWMGKFKCDKCLLQGDLTSPTVTDQGQLLTDTNLKGFQILPAGNIVQFNCPNCDSIITSKAARIRG